MGFNTDGSSHSLGVHNEKAICNFLMNKRDEDPLRLKEMFDIPEESVLSYKHIGGTGNVSDMDISCNDPSKPEDEKKLSGTSIKNHKQGTYDYINTTKLQDFLPAETVEVLSSIKKQMKENYYKCDEDKMELCRKEINDKTDSLIDNISSDSIKNLIKEIHKRNPELIIVNNCSESRLLTYKANQLKELSEYPSEEYEYFMKKKRNAKTSRSIYRRGSNGEEIDTTLRIRIVLNNGVKALLGLSSSNLDSSFSIKVQQENVDNLLRTLSPYSSCEFI